MEFTKPTTKEEMFATLKEIYFYYNHKKFVFDVAELERLNVQRMTFTPLTDEELLEKATDILSGQHLRETREMKKQLIFLKNIEENLLWEYRKGLFQTLT